MIRNVKIGQMSVLLRAPPDNTGQVVCGHVVCDVVCDVGYASAYRFFTELHKIRDTLVAAHAVLTERGSEGKTSAAEMHLARLLVDLEVLGEEPRPRADHAHGIFTDDPYAGPMNKKGDW